MTKKTKHKVAILAHPQVSLFELGCAVELFGLPRPEIENWYVAEVVAWKAEKLTANAGVQLQAKTVSSLQHYTHLVVPYWPVDQADNNAELLLQLEKFYKAKKTIISFCSGAFLLAEAGFLHQKKSTTHWRYAERFKKRFPATDYVDNVLYVFDGQIGCSAGSAAGLDLGIELIRRDYGYQIANQVARRLVMPAHRTGGQSQFVETPLLQVPNHFSQALDWAMENLHQPIDINLLAARAKMSRRTFDRKFRSSFDMSAQQWLVLQRIEKSKQLLESSSSSIEKIAELSGFNNAATLRHHYRQVLGVSPQSYRKQFAKK